MLTRYERELERQADVVTVREPQRYVVAELPVGIYMYINKALEFLKKGLKLIHEYLERK